MLSQEPHAIAVRRYRQRHLKAMRRFDKKRNKIRSNDPKFAKKKSILENVRRRRIQKEAIKHYGGKCYCCGEIIGLFLSLDHKNGGGTKHRKAMHMSVAEWARNNGWPKSLRVACHNCNFGAHLNGGICPHQTGG